MFDLGFTRRDAVRAVSVFLVAFVVTLAGTSDLNKAALYAACTAGILAVKNYLLADGTLAKG